MSFEGVKEFWPNTGTWFSHLAQKINQIMNGKTNNIGTVTLSPNTAATVVQEAAGRIGQETYIALFPTTAAAATEFGGGALYISGRSVANNTFTIAHASNSASTRTFAYCLIG